MKFKISPQLNTLRLDTSDRHIAYFDGIDLTENERIRYFLSLLWFNISLNDSLSFTSMLGDTKITSDDSKNRTHNHLAHKRTLNHLAKLALNDWTVFWERFYTVHLTVCYYHVTYTFWSKSTLRTLNNLTTSQVGWMVRCIDMNELQLW